jgi:hypothetical protein
MHLLQAPANDRQGMTPIWLERLPSVAEFMSHPNEPDRWRERPVSGLPGAYARAASMLMEGMIRSASETPGGGNALLPPYLFLWRHHIELQLKAVLGLIAEALPAWEAATGQALPPNIFGDVQGEHSLDRLWRRVRPRAETVWGRGGHLWHLPGLRPAEVSDLIRQLHAIDPDGQGVRYDHNRNGGLTMLGISRVDLEWAEHNMRGIAEFLSWARAEIGAVMRILPSEAEDQEQRHAMWEAMRDEEGL